MPTVLDEPLAPLTTTPASVTPVPTRVPPQPPLHQTQLVPSCVEVWVIVAKKGKRIIFYDPFWGGGVTIEKAMQPSAALSFFSFRLMQAILQRLKIKKPWAFA